MKIKTHHRATFFGWTDKFLLLFGFVVCLSWATYGQDSRGDVPKDNKRQIRENRFKSKSKRVKAKKYHITGRRIRSDQNSRANRAITTRPSNESRVGKPLGPIYNRPSTEDSRVGKPMGPIYNSGSAKGPRVGKPLGRIRNSRSAKGPRVGKPLGPIYNSRSAKGPRVGKPLGRIYNGSSHRARAGTPLGPVYRSTPRNNQRAVSNKGHLSRLKRMQSDPGDKSKRKQKVMPRSVSRAYISTKSINPIARFKRKQKKGEQAHTRDIAGRKLRKVNYRSQRPAIQSNPDPYFYKKRTEDRPYHGKAGGGKVRTRSEDRQKAWRGDIAKRRILGKRDQYRQPKVGQPLKGGGFRSATRRGERSGIPVPVRPPGQGSKGVGYQGNIKRVNAKPAMGRQGAEYRGRIPLFSAKPSMGRQGASWQGRFKGQKPVKGGGSVSGGLWNNKQKAIAVRPPSGALERAGRYSGNLKAKKPLKLGGSVSGKLWNNKETAIPVRPPSGESQNASSFPGKMMLFDAHPSMGKQGADWQGWTKARKPKKGGGSISGVLWNNKEAAIKVYPPSEETRRAASHPGSHKFFEVKPMMADQGEMFTGHKKQYKFLKNKNSAEESLKLRDPGKVYAKAGNFQGNIKMKKFDFFSKEAKRRKEFHPDAKFVKLNKNNVAEEKSTGTSLKLLWSKWFRKNETQPDHLKDKDKDHKPRYDKGEAGLWND